MEINLFNFHSRSATVYVAAGQIYAEAESNANELVQIALGRVNEQAGFLSESFDF